MKSKFVDLYAPTTFDEVVGQQEIIKKMKGWIKDGKILDCCLSGPAGIGKTTLAKLFAKEIFGEYWESNFCEYNASDNRGIDFVRDQIKRDARNKNLLDEPKIIFLDEADAMTKDAQDALKRIIEKYSSNCRFFLACNEPHKIIDPIMSRCPEIPFKPLTVEEIIPKIQMIAEKENFKITNEAIEKLIKLLLLNQGD